MCPWSERKKLGSKQRGVGNSCKDEGQWEGLVVHAEEREVVRTKGRPPRKPGPSPRTAASGEVVFLRHGEAGEESLEGMTSGMLGLMKRGHPILK